MAILIEKENNEKTVFGSLSDSLKLVNLILELNKNKVLFKAFDVGIDMKTYRVVEDTKKEIIIEIAEDIDLSETIKRISFSSTNDSSLSKFYLYTNSKKRVSPEKILKELELKLKELNLFNKVDLIFSSWAKQYKYNSKTIYEDNSSWFKFENNSWVKKASKRRRIF